MSQQARVRLEFELSVNEAALLSRLQAKSGQTFDGLIWHAIKDEAFLLEMAQQGSRLAFEHADGEITVVRDWFDAPAASRFHFMSYIQGPSL